MWKITCFLALLALLIHNGAANRDRNNKPHKIVCYLGSWANYRNGEGKFIIEDIDPFLCTHLVYGFAKLNTDNKIAAYDPYLDLKENWGLGAYQRFNELRKKNPHLTTILAIGGWNEGSVKYSNMASNPASRKVFVDSCVDFLQKYDFDGLDLDWEYPAMRGGKPEDKRNFVYLLKELRSSFQPHGFLLSAAVSAGKPTIDAAYDIPEISKYLDFINLMSYDFNGAWSTNTGHNAPLYAGEDSQNILNVDYAVNYWLSKGCPRKKLVLGMPLYGRSFTLRDARNNGLGAPATGPGTAGPLTGEGGMLGYNEICKFINQGGWTVRRDNKIKAPYAFKDRQWVGFDDPGSIAFKVNYLKSKGLGGGMVWSIETDDFRGICHGHKFPLLNVIRSKLNGPSDESNVIPDAYTTIDEHKPKPLQTTEWIKPLVSTTVTEPDIKCEKPGYFRYPGNCEKFYHCFMVGNDFKFVINDCPPGTLFDTELSLCNYPASVEGC